MTEDEHELHCEIPTWLNYELTRFNNPRPVVVGGGPECCTIDEDARTRCRRLLNRITELQRRIRRNDVLDRWYLRKLDRRPDGHQSVGPLTAMGMDEVIIGRRIVDQGP